MKLLNGGSRVKAQSLVEVRITGMRGATFDSHSCWLQLPAVQVDGVQIRSLRLDVYGCFAFDAARGEAEVELQLLFQHGEGPGGGIVSAIVYLDGRHGGQRRRSLLPGGKSRGGAQEGAAAVVVDRGDEVGDGVEDAARRGLGVLRARCLGGPTVFVFNDLTSCVVDSLRTYLLGVICVVVVSPVLSIESLPLFTANSAFTFPWSNITPKSDQECSIKEFVSGQKYLVGSFFKVPKRPTRFSKVWP